MEPKIIVYNLEGKLIGKYQSTTEIVEDLFKNIKINELTYLYLIYF